jgi:hypothetical protein
MIPSLEPSPVLTLDSLLLHLLLATPLPLPVEILALLISTHAAEQSVSFFLLEAIARELTLLCFLFLIKALDLGNLLVAGSLDAPKSLRAEACMRSEEVR